MNSSSAMNSSTTGAFMDSNGCMVLPPGTTINLAAQKMWTAEYAWIATGVFGAFMLLAVFNLLSAHKYSHNGKARPLFLLLSLFALFRTAGFATRGWAATISGGPSIPLFISVLVLQAAGFLPLLKILFQVSSEWASTGTKSKTARGVFKALPRVLDVLLFITVSAAITGASWVGQAQASLCTPSNIAVTIRNVSILMISALTWIGVIITLSVILMTRKRIAIWLFVQALLLAVRTSYTLISTLLMPTILQDEVSFYFMSIVPEALFVAPFIAGLYFLDRYLPEEEEELGDIFRGGADYNKPFTSNKRAALLQPFEVRRHSNTALLAARCSTATTVREPGSSSSSSSAPHADSIDVRLPPVPRGTSSGKPPSLLRGVARSTYTLATMPSPSDRIATECGIHPFARFYITARFADALLRPLASKCDDIPVHRLVLASQSPYFDDLFSRAPEQSTRLSTGQAVEVSPSEMAASAEEEEEEEEDEEEFNDAITMEEDEDEKESALGEPRAVASSFSPKVPKRFQETSPRSRQQPKTSPFSPADMATSCSSATAVSGDVVVGVYTVPIEDEAALRLTLEWFYFGDLDLDLIGCWGVMKAAREFKVPALAARVRGFVEAQVCANEGRSRSAECLTEAKPAMWGHEAWASAILGAVRAGVENALVERMVAASVRDLFMDEEQGIVGNEGNEERSFFDEDLEDDEEMRDEDSGGQQWVYRPSRAFRAYEILRRLVSQRDNDGDIISPTEMTALFSAVPFDRFRFRELEQIRGDARLPRDIVSNALMSGLMIREAQRTSMKKTFAAIVGMMAGGSMSSLPSQDPRMAPAVLKGSLATTSSITEIKSDDDEVRCAPPGSHVRTDEMKNPPPTAVAAENATGPAAPWLLEEGDGGGTVRVKQLNGKKKRGALNPSGSAPVANRKHFELIEDGCATVKGGLDGKLKPFPRRVRPSLSNCFDTSSVHSGKSDNSASASGDEDAVEEVVRHRESRALPLLPVQTATVEISESARPMETPPVTAIEPPAVVVRKMLAPPYTIGPPMTATPYPTVRQFIDQMKTDVIELKTVEVVRPLVAHQSVRISVPALAAPASEAPVSITAERSFSVEAIEDAAASRETSQGLPMQAPPRVAVPPSQQRIAGPTSQQQRDIGPPPPVGPMVVRKIPTPELLEKVAQKLLTIPADPDTRVQMPQEKVQTEARRQSERPYETEPAPQAWKGLADNKRNFWAGGVAPYAVVERVPRNVDGGEEDDPPLMSVRKEQQQRRKSQPALAAVSETLPTPGASFDGSPKAGTLPREMPAPSVTTQPTFSTAPVSTNGSTIATDVEDDDDRASDCSSTTSGGDRTFTQNPRMRKHRHLQSAKQSRQRQKEISQKLNGGKRLKNATSMPIMATQAREDEPLQPLPPPMRMLGPTGSLGAMMNVNPDEIVPDPRYVAPISPMTLMPGLVNTNKSMPPTPKILSGASNTIAYGEHAPLTGPRAATNMAGIHSKGDDTLLDKVDFGGGLDLNFKLNDSAEGSRNTSFSFEGTRDDASFHWPDTAPMGGSAVDSRPHSRSSSVSSSTSTNRSSSPSRDLLIQNVGMKVPNPVRRSKRIPSGLAVNTGAAAGGAAKQHVVGTWGPSSNPFKAAIGGQGREYNRSSTPAGSAGLAPAVSSSWGYQQGASMMEDVRKADGQRVIAVKNETDQNTMGPPYVAAPATSRGVVSQQGPSKGGSRKYTLSKKQIKEFMGNVLKF